MLPTKIVLPIIFLFSSLLILIKLQSPHPDLNACNVEGFKIANPQTDKVKATKVVVEPWRGRHHVYGIFIVPMLYEPGYPVLIDIKGTNTFCRRITLVSQTRIDGVTAPPQSTVLKFYLKTRTAFWLIITGKINQLKQLDNWTLTYSYYPNCIGVCPSYKQ